MHSFTGIDLRKRVMSRSKEGVKKERGTFLLQGVKDKENMLKMIKVNRECKTVVRRKEDK